jgi:hypothetical protein
VVVVGEGFSGYGLTAVLKNRVYCASLQLALGSPGGTESGQYLVPAIQSNQLQSNCFHFAHLSLKVPVPCRMPSSPIPDVGTRARMVNGALADFLANHPDLELGGAKNFTDERQRHTEVFSFHKLPKAKINPIGDVEFTAIRGPHGTLPIRVFYPLSGEGRRARNEAGALIYFHGGGYTVGCVDEFENGLRLIAEVSGCQV